MPNCSEGLRSGIAARCAVCDGKFGLVRHYSWRTPLCSKKCVDRFRARRASDRNWVGWLQFAFEQLPEHPREGFMTVQISQRGKEYLETARTLFRAARTMTDSAIAGQLKAFADDYQRRVEKASHVDAAKAFARPAVSERWHNRESEF
jgi:hypothetical protein